MIKLPSGWKWYNALLVFIFMLVLALASASAMGDETPDGRIGLGYTFGYSSLMQGDVSVQWYDWELGVQMIASGDTSNGYQEKLIIPSITKVIEPDWCYIGCFYQKIGLAYTPNSVLIGPINYKLGVGLAFSSFDLEYIHYSSAGINPINNGIDNISLRFKLPLKDF